MEGKIYGAICDIMGDIGSIGKDKKTQSGSIFSYRGVDDIYNALQPVLVKHRVFPMPMVISEKREERQSSKGNNLIYTVLHMKYRLYADDGSFVEAEVIGEGMDSGDKSANKAMSVAYKYAMFQLLCIPTEAVDPDAEVHSVQPIDTKPSIVKISPEQIAFISSKYNGESLVKLLANNSVTKLEDMPMEKATAIITKYEAWAASKK